MTKKSITKNDNMKYSIVKQDAETHEVFTYTPMGWEGVESMAELGNKLWFFQDISIMQILAKALEQDSQKEIIYFYAIAPHGFI